MKFGPVLILVWALSGSAWGNGGDGLVAEAELQFEQAKETAVEDPDASRDRFRSAAEIFALAAPEVGDPGAAHYNAANAFALAGDVGGAVYHYRMAQIYHPFDANIAHNLESVRDQVLDSVTVRPSRSAVDFLAAGARFFPAWMRCLVFVLGYLALFAALLTMLVRGRSARGKLVASICGGIASLAALSLAVEWWVCQGGREGVVAAEEVVARTGDGDVYSWAFSTPLHAGVEFQIVERRGRWLRVRLWSGDEGWVPQGEVRVIEAL